MNEIPQWSQLSIRQRGQYLLQARQHILTNLDRFAETITRATGKPKLESINAELLPVTTLLHYFATHSAKLLQPERVGLGFMGWLRRTSTINYQPYGVVAVISPWNYPFAIPMGHIAMALVAGNTVLCKSSEVTPAVGQLLVETWQAAGLPHGVFGHVCGGAAVGEALMDQPINKLFFTGSVAVGKILMQRCSEKPIPCVLELGGKDAMIVRADADLEQSSSGAVWGAFTNCGQACAGVERVYVHSDIVEKFIQLVTAKTMALRLGDGLNPDTDVGPLISAAQLSTVERHVDDARTRGAHIHTGGERVADLPGFFYRPTVLSRVDHSFLCMRDETFGPLLPIMTFTNDSQAIALANDSPFGLTASIWSRNLTVAQRLASQLHAGTVMINDCVYTHGLCQTPWGGNGASGMGRSHGRVGLLECVWPQHINVHRGSDKSVWWYPYDTHVTRAFHWLTRTVTGPAWKWILSLPAVVYLLIRNKR